MGYLIYLFLAALFMGFFEGNFFLFVVVMASGIGAIKLMATPDSVSKKV